MAAAKKTTKKIKFQIDPPEKHWVGDGFNVHTMFHPTGDMYRHTTPFIMMDYAPPKNFPATEKKLGVGEHPHRGFETVTIAYEGEVEHKDSAGGGGIIGKGDVQWMTAASGLVHEEFHSREFARRGGDFEMVQLWVNLPKEHKMTKPRYQGVKNEKFALKKPANGVELKIIAGKYEEAKGPCETFSPINMYDVKMEPNSSFDLEVEGGTNLIVLNRKNALKIDGQDIEKGQVVVFDREGSVVSIEAVDGGEMLVLNGKPIDEPIFAYGPFVMNSREEILEAIDDFNAGKMGTLVETYK